jgi:nucleotide-binding universal stress UspA family protein
VRPHDHDTLVLRESAVSVSNLGWRILHPTDFSEASHVAFTHALKLALATQGRLHMLHVSDHDGHARWRNFPGVRDALERWGVLPAGSGPEAVLKLGIEIEKVEAVGDDPVAVTRDFLRSHPAEIIVLATHQRDGLAQWRKPSVAEGIARQAHEVALFVPAGRDGFVDAATGRLRLPRILIPVAREPAAQPAIEAAIALASLESGTPTTFRVVHVGDEVPAVLSTERPDWIWEQRRLTGTPAEALIEAVEDFQPNLVVMTTAGHDGFMDALRGSTTERVVRAIGCPLLAVSVLARLPRLAWS